MPIDPAAQESSPDGPVTHCWSGLGARHRGVKTLWHDASLPGAEAGSLLPYGNGRSYSDVCLNPDNSLLATRRLDRFMQFDSQSGTLRCEAGLLLGEILALILAQGWILPVLPGTRYVTLGGAIANDVHGKNHCHAGSFGHHVRGLSLRRSDGEVQQLRPGDARFAASVGGLGLTGLITEAELSLRRVGGPVLEEHAAVFGNLDEGLTLLQQASERVEYAAAWLDCLPRREGHGRGLLLSARHCDGEGDASALARAPRVGLGRLPRMPLVNRLSARAFNALYFAAARRRPPLARVHCLPFLFTLDALGDWNRLYGRRGLRQYQCVVPPAAAANALREILDAVVTSRETCALAVLKRFGACEAAGMLSFPRAGFSLALDFPNAGDGLLKLFTRLDSIVRDAEGALYPAKDARMPPAMFRHSFPHAEAFAEHVDPRFSSAFWRRVWP